ncbi:DUF4190 domain-containing protein [Nocardioides sp.]|uniref:DUF4190 domain-containing protein n=1 Tax=Nocardioides sp. TaxID=35761 RepID=UPI0027339725|nr:hypothetical protein [Nocardioides sp.]MDP3891444.1 hypothetical protein [Nocardioides sp.]
MTPPDDQSGQGNQPGQPDPTNPYTTPGQPQPGYGNPGYGNPGYGNPGYGNPGYGNPGYQQQPFGQHQPAAGSYGYGAPVAPAHPSATTAMVLGLVALVGALFTCGLTLVIGPFAWAVGGKAVREIDQSPGQFSGREQANAGKIMGVISTVLLVLSLLATIAFFSFIFTVGETSFNTY